MLANTSDLSRAIQSDSVICLFPCAVEISGRVVVFQFRAATSK